jgi:hypothetical protein
MGSPGWPGIADERISPLVMRPRVLKGFTQVLFQRPPVQTGSAAHTAAPAELKKLRSVLGSWTRMILTGARPGSIEGDPLGLPSLNSARGSTFPVENPLSQSIHASCRFRHRLQRFPILTAQLQKGCGGSRWGLPRASMSAISALSSPQAMSAASSPEMVPFVTPTAF